MQFDVSKNTLKLRLPVGVKSAEIEQMSEFWQELRQFYRTGKKPKETSQPEGLFSIFHKYLIEISNAKDDNTPATIYNNIENYLIEYQLDIISKFKYKLKELIGSLHNLLDSKIEGNTATESYGLAAEMIALDKLTELIPKRNLIQISESRKKRLKEILVLLKDGLMQYQEAKALLLVTNKSDELNDLKQLKQINISKNIAVAKVHTMLKAEISAFTALIKAYRIASLEVDDAYDEMIHDDYFSHFSWYRLSQEEKSLFRPMIFQIDHKLIMTQLDDLSKLLSTNWPIKLLVTNHEFTSQPSDDISWEEASHGYRPELTNIAIAHRNVDAYQVTMAHLNMLTESIKSWISSSQPSILHVLLPEERNELIYARAATYGRYFPMLAYNQSKNNNSELKWRIDSNPDADNNWPLMNAEISTDEEVAQQQIAFTYADYKAFFETKVNELMLVPQAYCSNYLISLHEYLRLAPEELIGKVPYIWLVDESSGLHRAAVPNVWVVSCQERLDNWQFLQQMAGVEYSTKVATTEKVNPEFSEEKLNEVRAEATREAAGRLINELLTEI